MISGDLMSTGAAKQDPSRPEPRLSMKPAAAAQHRIDGGWWPRSRNPESEFPELAAALRPLIGEINRVSYHLGMWETAPRKLVFRGRAMHLEGFRSMDPHTVAVVSPTRARLTLLVVPPDAPAEVARAAMASAARDSSSSTEEMLATARPVIPAPRSTEPAQEERWETDGGHTRAPAPRA
ncbi:DUF5994 family protein [Saccharopolyspora griseoalba]|uniref:DUF5994 family protein n=1 Tax=Saccharopolyspora griseoalba TaxID=1431848 RepID=A0ABW2LJI8_9PSEU